MIRNYRTQRRTRRLTRKIKKKTENYLGKSLPRLKAKEKLKWLVSTNKKYMNNYYPFPCEVNLSVIWCKIKRHSN